MAINLLPSELQDIIQEGYLERTFQEALRAKLGFRAIADREPFPAKIGETITKTRPGLLATPSAPITAAAASDLDSGLSFDGYTQEQYALSLAKWGHGLKTNLVTEGVAIGSKFLLDAKNLGEQASRKIDELARDALFDAYMGGNTRVKTTLGSPAAAVAVDDVRGFAAGDVVTVHLTDYTVASVAVDGSNTSTVFGGRSGVITFTGNVTVANATAGNAVVNTKAPMILRPNSRATAAALQSGDLLNADMLIQAVAELHDNGVPEIDGFYNLYIGARQAAALQSDTKFLNAFQGAHNSGEIRSGAVSEIYGVRLVKTHMNPVDGGVHRAILVGQGALVEGVYTNNGYKNQASLRDSGSVIVVDDVAHIVREPLDALKEWVTQSWSYIGGFVVPTDIGTNSDVLPSASARSYKRGIIMETK